MLDFNFFNLGLSGRRSSLRLSSSCSSSVTLEYALYWKSGKNGSFVWQRGMLTMAVNGKIPRVRLRPTYVLSKSSDARGVTSKVACK